MAVVLALGAIGVLTLRPAPPPAVPLPMVCLVCGELGGVDVVLNLTLFIPLGATLVLAGVGWRRAALVAAATSLAVEALQYSLIPGRDASLSDLLTNSAGGAAGALLTARWHDLLAPPPRTARRYAIAAASAALAVMALTAALLRPAIPEMGFWGQWTPQQLRFEPYSGRVHDFRINGIVVPYNLVPESDALRRRLLSGQTRAHLEFTAGHRTTRLSAIARVGSRFQEVLLLGADGRDFVFRTRLATRDWRLRTPGIMIPGALPSEGERTVAEAGLRDAHWYATMITSRGAVHRSVPFSVALGWTFVLPFDHPLAPADVWLSALWLAAMIFPAAVWGAMGGAAGRLYRASGFNVWWGGVMAMLALGLLAIPYMAHFPPAVPTEWLGLALGGVAGACLSAPLRRGAVGPESR